MNIVDEIGMPAMLEQTAEECVELAQACLKYARYLREENPIRKTKEECLEDLEEELADVQLCMEALTVDLSYEKYGNPYSLDSALGMIIDKKRERWEQSLRKETERLTRKLTEKHFGN